MPRLSTSGRDMFRPAWWGISKPLVRSSRAGELWAPPVSSRMRSIGARGWSASVWSPANRGTTSLGYGRGGRKLGEDWRERLHRLLLRPSWVPAALSQPYARLEACSRRGDAWYREAVAGGGGRSAPSRIPHRNAAPQHQIPSKYLGSDARGGHVPPCMAGNVNCALKRGARVSLNN